MDNKQMETSESCSEMSIVRIEIARTANEILELS